jgi:glycosyltransferase involved in cell wall biosynthesis/SAM-dependent methyltransferase
VKLSIAFHVDSIEFTAEVIAGTASLGGSESACLGLARALKARGHEVYIFTTKLHADAPKVDQAGVRWFSSDAITDISRFVDWDVFCALRLPHVFNLKINAGLRVLWNQDLMADEGSKNQVMSLAWAYDAIAYVSEYHRKQWEGMIPELAPIGWVTKNGFDPQYVPSSVNKNPNRIIHITRPERGLRPLLAMWPELKKQYPQAELALCRYNSMYDASGWGKVCASYDQAVKQMSEQVGGITYLGELGKPALYQAIAESAVMWYPGVVDFAETSCIAAIESQACGTPFVGSWKGALPETVPGGVLVQGDADKDTRYQDESIAAVVNVLKDCARQSRGYRDWQTAGRAHVQPAYTYDTIAGEWEAWIVGQFERRRAKEGHLILKRLLHNDDHVAAEVLADQLGDHAMVGFCQHVMDGKDQGSEDYSERALDPLEELKQSPRIGLAAEHLKGKNRILDIACGNGACALGFAQANPDAHVIGIDYAIGNIRAAIDAAKMLGLSDRCTFICAAAYNFETHDSDPDFVRIIDGLKNYGLFDGVFIGEFLEHIVNVQGLLNAVHQVVTPDARIVMTVPAGPFIEIAARDMPVKKGHVHHFRPDDLRSIWGEQQDFSVGFFDAGETIRGSAIGHWILAYTPNGQPLGERPIAKRILTTRPQYPLSVGIIANDAIDIRRCLMSLWQIADEIVIGNTGAKPEDLDLVCAEFPHTRVVEIGPIDQLKGGFSEARNKTLQAATGYWFMWIDTDEVLVKPQALHTYLEGGIFQGYALKQNHLMLDTPKTFDTPVRVFKKQPSVQFYGCIHEQPQMGDCNGDIIPALQLNDVEIAHVLGYLTEEIRRQKCLQRNLPLLVRDQQQFPDRKLGKLLVLRDFLNLATWEMEGYQGKLTTNAVDRLQKVIGLFEAHFSDPANKHHALARPFYEAALTHLAPALASGPYEVEFAFVAQEKALKGRPKAERVLVRTKDQLEALLDHRVAQWKAPMHPKPLDCEPIVVVEQREAVAV